MESDSTLITGSPAGLKAPRPGDVVCERFEIRDVVESDALVLTYRAVDQETEATVLVRVTTPGLLGEREAKRVLERLRPLVGSRGEPEGASLWPGLLDVDREGALVSTVESWPRGTSFRAVLEARRAKQKRFDAAELLPFVGRIAAALDGLPDRGGLSGLHHGDLRANRIFVHPDGMSLTGGFLLSALPGDAVAEVLTRDVVLRRTLPPEFADGLAGRPADRHSVAALAWEALEGVAPPPSVRPADCRSEPALGAILVRYLDPDPAARPATLRGLVDALAARANLPIPDHRDRMVLRGGMTTSSEENATTTETGSYQLTDGELLPLDATALDKRVLDGKTDRAPMIATKERGSDLDPDLVAIAKAASAISGTGTFQLGDEELVPVSANKIHQAAATPAAETPKKKEAPARLGRPTQPMGSVPEPIKTAAASPKAFPRVAVKQGAPIAGKKPQADRTEELGAQDLVALGAGRVVVPQKKLPSPLPAPIAAPVAVAAPAAIAAPIASPQPEAAKPRAAWEHTQLPSSGAPLPSLQQAHAAPASPTGTPARSAPPRAPAPTAIMPMPPAEQPSSGLTGILMIIVAVVVASAILGAAFWYRAHEEQVRHEREIEERLRELGH